jgi:leucyl aminopeptidase
MSRNFGHLHRVAKSRETTVLAHLTEAATGEAVAIIPLSPGQLADWLEKQTAERRAWVASADFSAAAGSVLLVPGAEGGLDRVLFGRDETDPWCWANLPGTLPVGRYVIDAPLDGPTAEAAALAWELACYQFNRYKSRPLRSWPQLVWPETAQRGRVGRTAAAVVLVRDLINTPASDMGPEELAEAARTLADRFGARCRSIVGDGLLDDNYPAIHAVGRASTRPPRLIDLRWGDEGAPKVTLVGKGVCFDSGGLDIKASANMKLMKKDMGGAAHALGVASMVMDAGLPVRLRVLIPAVENAISGNAFRPLDVLQTRKGLTVEVGNTDAEGRLILADALAEADRETPDLLVDFATLTGAARTALGPDLPALFTDDEALAAELLAGAQSESDPLWRLPLWAPYRRFLESPVADLVNSSDTPFAGAINAALFLREFVSPTTPWAHLDLLGWNPSPRPGRPEGGEAMGLRAVYRIIEQRFGDGR